jgi:hypothetical protein
MASDTIELNTPITDGGVRALNFFNGRLLSASDLSREQGARRQADACLGAAIGPGVCWGLTVRADPGVPRGSRVLRVSAGLALNGAGQTLALQAAQSLNLAPLAASPADIRSGFFSPRSISSGGTEEVGEGLWLLTLAPSRCNDGRAQVSTRDAVRTRFTTDSVVEAVQFRLLPVASELLAGRPDSPVKTLQALHRMRSAVAAEFFQQDTLASAHAEQGRPGVAGLVAGLAARLRQAGLTDGDVPLALVFFQAGLGLRFVDCWAVRRRSAQDAPGGPRATPDPVSNAG